MELKATIDRFEGNFAVLVMDDRTLIQWPKNKLPDGAAEGGVVVIKIETSEEAEKTRRATAKDILNEILNSEE